jgi:hypothetical protein
VRTPLRQSLGHVWMTLNEYFRMNSDKSPENIPEECAQRSTPRALIHFRCGKLFTQLELAPNDKKSQDMCWILCLLPCLTMWFIIMWICVAGAQSWMKPSNIEIQGMLFKGPQVDSRERKWRYVLTGQFYFAAFRVFRCTQKHNKSSRAYLFCIK